MDRDEIIKYKDYLLNNIMFHNEYDKALGLKRKILMVEGKTDADFIKNVLRSDVRCLPVVNIISRRNAFSTSSSPIKVNHKDVITTILHRISMYPDAYDFPKGAENWPLYGMVDNDFGSADTFSRVSNLFFTDTHDIETLMIATDPDFLTRIEECTIRPEEVQTALYLAFQLSAFRKAIKDDGTLNQRAINGDDGIIDYNAFTDGDRINLTKILRHINSQSDPPLKKEKFNRTLRDIASSMKKLLDKDGLWKKPFFSFSYELDDPIWMDINGHDVLSALLYLNEKAKEVFTNASGYALNRDFESALPKTYDYTQFKKTQLHEKMKAKDLIFED